MKIHWKIQGTIAALAIALVSGCSTAKVTKSTSYSTDPAAPPSMIYVTDFELKIANIHKEEGLVPRLNSPGPVRRFVFHETDDPDEVAAKLVNKMAESIVKDLKKAGYAAERLSAGAPGPTNGWMVRGVFTEVQEGNQVRRAVIGFGMGKTEVQVVTGVDNLSFGPPKPLYEVQTTADSGDAPGAAPMVIISPAAIPVRFVMAGQDLNKNTEKTAAKIAEEIGKKIGTPKK